MKKVFLLVFMCLTMLIFAENPTINIQGVLRNSEGNAVEDGEKTMVFTFFDASEGGAQMGGWSEEMSVVVINGIYNAQLGSVSPLNNLAFDKTYFLQIEVDGVSMDPRLPLSLTPYALSVRGIDNVFPNTGNVGIGTAEPQEKLQVVGNTILNGNVNTTGNSSVSGNSIINGNVGIGTTNPQGKLQVSGKTIISGDLGVGTTNPATTVHIATGADASASGGGFLRIGENTNILIDNNEIMARVNNQPSGLYVNGDGGEVHLGSSSTSSKTRINGGLEVHGQVNMIGNQQAWTHNSYDWAWKQASTDGMVVAWVNDDEGSYLGIEGLTNSTSSDTNIIEMAKSKDHGDGSKYVSVTFPVKKGQYWKLNWWGGNHPNLDYGRFYFIPFGL